MVVTVAQKWKGFQSWSAAVSEENLSVEDSRFINFIIITSLSNFNGLWNWHILYTQIMLYFFLPHPIYSLSHIVWNVIIKMITLFIYHLEKSWERSCWGFLNGQKKIQKVYQWECLTLICLRDHAQGKHSWTHSACAPHSHLCLHLFLCDVAESH